MLGTLPRATTVALTTLLVATSVAVLPASVAVNAAATGTLVVDDPGDAPDAVPGDGACATATGRCSIRAAIDEANAAPGAQTIVLGAADHVLTGAAGDDANASGDLDVTDAVTIEGVPGSTLRAPIGDRALHVLAPLTLVDVAVVGGRASRGGAVAVRSDLTATRVALSGGDTTLSGGGLWVEVGATVTGEDVHVHGNRSSGPGGGVLVDGSLDLAGSAIVGNASDRDGAGLFNRGSTTLRNTTVSGNTAALDGGGVANRDGASVTLRHVTITANAARNGGGVSTEASTTAVSASIVAANLASGAGPDCRGTLVTGRTSLLEVPDGCTPDDVTALITETLAELETLRPLGTTSPAHRLNATSPARNALAAPCDEATDQIGVTRASRRTGTRCDLGAIEYLSGLLVTVATDRTELSPRTTRIPVEALPETAVEGPQEPPIVSVPLNRTKDEEGDPAQWILNQLPIGELGLPEEVLGATLLSQLPVEGGWPVLLAGTPLALRPEQSVSLLEAIAITEVAGTPLGHFDLTASPLGTFSLGGLMLGSLTLDEVVLGSGGLADWCQVLALEGYDCAALGIDPTAATTDVTIAELALEGLPLNRTPLNRTPLNRTPLNRTPLNRTPLEFLDLNAIHVEGTPLNRTPLNRTPLNRTPLGQIPLESIPLNRTQLGLIFLLQLTQETVNRIVDCANFDCEDPNATLADVEDAGMFLAGAVLEDLLFYGDATLGDLPHFNGTTIAELVLAAPELFDDVLINDILAAMVAPEERPWEEADLELRQIPADDALADASVGAEALIATTAAVSGELSINLPPGFPIIRPTVELNGAPLAVQRADRVGMPYVAQVSLVEGANRLSFTTRSGRRIVEDRIAVRFVPDGGSGGTNGDQPVTVTDPTEPNDDAASATPLADDELYMGTIRQVGPDENADVDVYSVLAVPGQRLTAVLANLAVDLDLALFADAATRLRGEPEGFARSATEVDGIAVAGDEAGHATVEGEIALLGDRPLLTVSANRSLENERIVTAALPGCATPDAQDRCRYYLQVSGAGGASSVLPYTIRVNLRGDEAVTCSPLTLPAATAGTAPLIAPATNTLFLVNAQRIEQRYGSTQRTQLMVAARQLAVRGDLGVIGAVYPVESDPIVAEAYTAWNERPCSVTAANAVVTQIGRLVDTLRATYPTIQHVVILGSDDIVPMARIPDATQLANERDHALGFAPTTPLGASLRAGFILSDDAYTDPSPIAIAERELFVPELAVGRLVETPAQIRVNLQRFIDFGGVLDGSTGLSSGYDFLKDGAEAIRAQLAAAGRPVRALIRDDWTRQELQTEMYRSDGPGIVSMNAHFDQTRALPADQDAAGTESDLLTTADIAAAPPAAIDRGIVYSMGCHSGLNVPDVEVGFPVPDWAQAFQARGTQYVGNTGYGYGDTDVVAYSEKLMEHFSNRLDGSVTIGQALAIAKNRYLAELGNLDAHHEKVMMQATMYGLPMFRISGTPLTRPAPSEITATPSGGQPGVAFHDVALTDLDERMQRVDRPRGAYFTIDGGTETVHMRPVQPRVDLDVTPTAGNLEARGVIVTGASSYDLTQFDPVFVRPTIDLAANEPKARFGRGAFPATLPSVHRSTAVELDTTIARRKRQELVVVAGQYIRDQRGQRGTQRLFTDVTTRVFYADAANPDQTPPTIGAVDATVAAGQVTFTVKVRDIEPTGLVQVLYADANLPGTQVAPRQWRSATLTHQTGRLWSTTVPTHGAVQVTYLVQAVDLAGNVGIDSRSGFNHFSAPVPIPAALQIPAATGEAGWHTGPVTFTATGTPDLVYRIDGGDWLPYAGPTTVSAEGSHVIEAMSGADEVPVRADVHIDATAPSIVPFRDPRPVIAADPPAAWNPDDVDVVLFGRDTGSGFAQVTYSATGANPIAPTTSTSLVTRVPITAEGVTAVRASGLDVAGNAVENTIVGTYFVRIDRTAPQISCDEVPAGWASDNVTVTCTATDAGSGVAPASSTVTLTTDVSAGTADGDAATDQRMICDGVGNCAVAGPVTGIKVDRSPPKIAVTAPAADAAYELGQAVSPEFACADDGAGVDSCTSGAVDTSTPGVKSVTFTATDGAGNRTTVTRSYTVRYRLCADSYSTRDHHDGDKEKKKPTTEYVLFGVKLCDVHGNDHSGPEHRLVASHIDDATPIDRGSETSMDFTYWSHPNAYTFWIRDDGLGSGPHDLWLTVDALDGYRISFTIP